MKRGTGQRTLHLVCQVCNDRRWVQAAPVTNFSTFEGDQSLVGEFTPVPCWACGPTKLRILA